MKILLATTMTLGTLCLLETNRPAKANLMEAVSPNIHLVRGEHAGGHRVEGRGKENHGGLDHEAGQESHGAEGFKAEGDHTTSPEDRMHTLGQDNATHDHTLNDVARDNALRNDALEDGGWGDGWTEPCPDGQSMNANGECASS